MNKVNSILKKALKKVEPPKEDLELIENSLKYFLEEFQKKIKKMKIDAEIFVGGSFAKNTVIKKDKYDVDVFVRFPENQRFSVSKTSKKQKVSDDKKYDISKLLEKALKGFRNVTKIHGSRDYFKIKIGPSFFIELIPVKKIKNPKEAENITDLSYSHVKYINKKIKSKKLLDEIRLAKAFCYANKCYGAESYISGFSGYSLELLIYYYKSFIRFVREITKIKEQKIIDIEKAYKNKSLVLMDINSAKLNSPIVLVDPTYKSRNVLAALSYETFREFQKACKKFIAKPSYSSFEIEKIDLKKIKENAKSKNYEFLLIETKTHKQEGDIAGSKLLKFYRHLEFEIKDFFSVKKKGFAYNGKKTAKFFFVVKNKGEIIHSGPSLKDKKNVERFKKKHKNTFSKKQRIHSKRKINFTLRNFINIWKNKNKKKLREMDISSLKLL